jgi:hypothetical protein
MLAVWLTKSSHYNVTVAGNFSRSAAANNIQCDVIIIINLLKFEANLFQASETA